MAASSSSSSGGSFKYDVFINFRGEDTRRCFVCHLYEALKLKALETFIDSKELQKGDDLSELLKAIQESRLSIVVFSKDYASSTWCLKELVQIMECMDRQKQIVEPIFYEVDPSHVRKLKENFAKHESDSNVNKEELESWKSSLTRAANLSGYHSKDYRDDIQLIKSIVEDILKKVIRISPSCKTDDLIGMDTHMNKIDSLFKSGVDDCRNVVGIWGMGGIGKSTIARAVYEKYSPQFEHKCFLDNVKEDITKKGARQMVEDLLSRILKIKDRSTLDEGLNMMRERLGEKKILLVLDDVDAMEQIDTLIGENPSFGDGSRIIITTRDKKLLDGFFDYKPEILATDEALELFRRYAFRTIKFSESYDEISKRAVKYAHGLPLALKVLGGLLDNKKLEEWEYELKKIKKISITFVDDNKIGRVLRASYDGLDECQKNIFLDIACFFRGKWTEEVTPFHESCGFFPETGLRVLEERSLVTVSGYGHLDMHDLIQEMGREIVRQESTKDPGRRSRLWYYEDVLQVLAQNTPAEAVEGIILDLSKFSELWVNYEVFVGMKRLKLLQLTNNLFSISTCKQHVSGDLKSLSNELRVLVWNRCPFKSLPSDFQPKNLIKIDMPRSRIEQLWEGTKPLPDLVHMDLSGSTGLTKTPDLAEATNLKRLNLRGCTSLLEVHPSISALESLVELNLCGCRELRSLPSSIHMKSLEELDLSGCWKLEEFPEISEVMERLGKLDLDETAVKELPSSINNLTGLVCLSMRNCTSLVSLPSSIHMKSLRYLYLSGCSKLEEFPEISEVMERLDKLDLDGTAVKELPSSINNLTGLVCLSMRNCTSLVSLPSSIHMKSLEELDLSGCSKLEEFPEISEVMERLGELDLDGTAVKELPSSINNLTDLVYLSMRNCTSLVSLPDEICDLACLNTLDLTGCSKLSKLPDNFQNWESLRECLKLVNSIVETAATDNQGEDLGSDYRMCLPGSDIPDWFNHQDRGSSVTVQLPPDWSHMSDGLAICAISNLRGADNEETLESAFCYATLKANQGQDNFYFRLLPRYQGGNDVPLESDHMILVFINSLNFETLHSGRKYTQATFRIVTTDSITDDPMTWKDCTWISSCGVRLFQMNAPSSVDLVCNVENRETEISSKRKRETLERGKEKMGVEVQKEEEECSGGPICSCFSLSGCTISLRKKQRQTEREAEGVAGLESEEADVSGEGGLLTLSL